jgi:hypothetical protein
MSTFWSVTLHVELGPPLPLPPELLPNIPTEPSPSGVPLPELPLLVEPPELPEELLDAKPLGGPPLEQAPTEATHTRPRKDAFALTGPPSDARTVARGSWGPSGPRALDGVPFRPRLKIAAAGCHPFAVRAGLGSHA